LPLQTAPLPTQHCVGTLFLYVQDGKMIDHVVGVVAPQLERKIAQYSAV